MLFPLAIARALRDLREKISTGGVQFTVTANEFKGNSVTIAIFAGGDKALGSEGGAGTRATDCFAATASPGADGTTAAASIGAGGIR
mmetsp:Transcript_50581/g.117937  ORF Transcript_50581/g.117937 Transcript_50581/m.117937 type:complete len:87 (+) Transcript_50581:215-475(+)